MRVVVTGMGALSSAGRDVCELDHALRESRSGIAPFGLNEDGYPPHGIAGRVATRAPAGVPRGQAMLDQVFDEAISQAGLEGRLAGARLYLGTIHGHLDDWSAARAGQPPDTPDNIVALPWSFTAQMGKHGLRPSDSTLISTACTASAVAVGLALDALRAGSASVAVVAGVEVMSLFLYDGFVALRALGKECRPFDARHDGLVLGEGAAALILETESHARRRGAHALAEIVGYGFGLDSSSLTAPDPSGAGAAAAMREALADARLAEPPRYVNAHGTGTKHNDNMECAALRRVFGANVGELAVSSTKPLMGHLCGAAGVTEVICSILALRGGYMPATLGLDTPEGRWDDIDFVRGGPREARFDNVLSLNSGFGGTNSAVVVQRA
ncbi:beta-ketoacyl-[acyl-carrier-protein] synthase family protein [Paraburkholderia terricola]|uniref:3-oxoacyl-[acyl-carrier-protein] synthase II n=1 Tax=Paraburkholderia terricola TaxID=169427 RepID=A0ABU1M1F5_9BURK|nr:beta-ketoacyl-[acyl-carrier-protein] synthase family protein [Paraburkholderia terricola]MDR6412836.1 3-oxoacyl-[acyl-carrier-protein] synthase II [Paraburkholderia terricola]MDR6450044.1 3-oxoacyl-[acyl-carrier-protein] synthase II [Paraburkholderia terricola]MDR6484892.1 3-oxoacyl-[acyl-carrier-protein] synthase II [Paraburkholderia terricola]